jgi:homeodomain-containing protein
VSTVHRVLKRWVEEGPEGLQDRPHGRPPGVRKVDLKAIEAVRRLQQNPNLGAFRVHAALAQVGIYLSPRSCGRILALKTASSTAWRSQRGRLRRSGRCLSGPQGGISFGARGRPLHIDDHELEGRAYVISVLDNHSRAILSSAVTRTQDLASYLAVLYAAVERYGSPEALVTDGVAGSFGRGRPRSSTRPSASSSTK